MDCWYDHKLSIFPNYTNLFCDLILQIQKVRFKYLSSPIELGKKLKGKEKYFCSSIQDLTLTDRFVEFNAMRKKLMPDTMECKRLFLVTCKNDAWFHYGIRFIPDRFRIILGMQHSCGLFGPFLLPCPSHRKRTGAKRCLRRTISF